MGSSRRTDAYARRARSDVGRHPRCPGRDRCHRVARPAARGRRARSRERDPPGRRRGSHRRLVARPGEQQHAGWLGGSAGAAHRDERPCGGCGRGRCLAVAARRRSDLRGLRHRRRASASRHDAHDRRRRARGVGEAPHRLRQVLGSIRRGRAAVREQPRGPPAASARHEHQDHQERNRPGGRSDSPCAREGKGSTLPDVGVVREVHANRFERAQAFDGARVAGVGGGRGAGRRRLRRTFPLGPRLHRLPGEHHRSVRGVQHQGLVARRVPGRGHQPQPRRDLDLAVQDLVGQPRRIDPLRDRVVGLVHLGPLGSLDEDRHARRDPDVLAAVVEVQVAVRHAGNVGERDAVRRERVLDRRHPRRERRLDLGVAEADPVVEQEDAVPMDHGVRVRRPPLALQQLLLVRRQAQLGDQERDDANVRHGLTLAPVRLRHVADDRGELLRARPHGPVAGRQVHPGDVAELGDTGEPRGAVLDGILVHLRREPRADHRGRQVSTRVVGQRDRLAQHATRHGHGAMSERLELFLGESIHVLLRRELLPVQWLLHGVEVGIQRGLARSGVDVDHRRDQLGHAVARHVAGEPRAAMDGEHDRPPRRPHRLADRVDVVGQRDRGAVGVDRLETGERQRGHVVAVGAQRGGDLVPRPRAEPEPGDQDDRCVRHGSTLEVATDNVQTVSRGALATGARFR